MRRREFLRRAVGAAGVHLTEASLPATAARRILGDPRRMAVLVLLLVPIFVFGPAVAAQVADQAAAAGTSLPDVLGGKKAYSPAFYSSGIFIVSILIGLGAGLITGCIGAGGGFILSPVDNVRSDDARARANVQSLIETWRECREYPSTVGSRPVA